MYPAQDSFDPTAGIGSWASEEKLYDYSHQGFSHETGHFTAMVWVGVKSVGCALVKCPKMVSEFLE